MKKIYLLLIMFLSMMMFSFQANAAFLTVPEDDWLVKNIMTPLFDADSSPFAEVSKIFLGGVLAFGGLLATYTIVVGTMSTAHDGQALGKKWSSVWVPIRTVLGVALIVPIKNGFCGIQLIIVWLALQGIALADSAWDAYSKDPLQGATYAAPALEPGLKPIFIAAMQAGACQYSLQQYVNKIQTQGSSAAASATALNSGSNISVLNPQGMTVTGGSYSTGVMYNFGFSASSGAQVTNAAAICGSFSLPGSSSNTGTSSSTEKPETAGDLVQMESLKEAVFNAQATALKDLLQTGSDLGYQIASTNSTDIDSVASQMKTALANYSNTVSTETSNSFSSILSDDGVSDMQKDGFISAGAWFYRIVKAQQAVTEQVSTLPLHQTFLTNSSVNQFNDKIGANIEKVMKVGNEAKKQTTNLSESGDDVNSWVNYFINRVNFSSFYSRMTENPLYAATNFGLNMISGAGYAVTAIVAATVGGSLLAGNIAGKMGGADTALLALSTFFAPLLAIITTSILLPGIYLAVYLPMIPFIIWTGTVIGWLVLVVEALFAGPLWAMAHMAPDADGLVGRQGQGYMLIMSLILRPVLMVIGFVAAISMLKPAALFVNYFYAFAAAGSNAGGISGFVQTIGSVIVYCMLLNNLVKKILSMIHALPDAILQWIGGAGSNVLGKYGQGVEGGTSNAFMGGVVGGAGASMVKGATNRLSQNSSSRLHKAGAASRFARAWSAQQQFSGSTSDEINRERKRAYRDMHNNKFGMYKTFQEREPKGKDIDFQEKDSSFNKYFKSRFENK